MEVKEAYSTVGPECPHCGFTEDALDNGFFDEMLDEVECSKCERTYRCRYYRSDSWTSKPMEAAT